MTAVGRLQHRRCRIWPGLRNAWNYETEFTDNRFEQCPSYRLLQEVAEIRYIHFSSSIFKQELNVVISLDRTFYYKRITNSVTSISDYAFADCESLKEITISNI